MTERLGRLIADDATFPFVLVVLCAGGSAVGAVIGLGAAWLASNVRLRGERVDWEGQD